MDSQTKQDLDVSVIIVNYNSFSLLNECIASVKKFSEDITYELIVIDNNSPEGDIKNELEDADDIVLICNDENKGFAAANNQGLEIAKGKYTLFLNNDTLFTENTLKLVFDFSESLSEKAIVGCKLLNKDGTLQHSIYDYPSLLNVLTSNFFLYAIFPKSRFFNKYHLMNRKVSESCKTEVVTGAFLFAPTDELRKLGGFDERFFFYNEDTDLCYRFSKEFGSIYYFPKTSIFHLHGGSTKSMPWFKYRNRFIAMIKFYQKHFIGLKFLIAYMLHVAGLLMRVPLLFVIGLIKGNKAKLLMSFYYLRSIFIYPKNVFKS